jgi:Ca2+-binding RTX toxin-like protein
MKAIGLALVVGMWLAGVPSASAVTPGEGGPGSVDAITGGTATPLSLTDFYDLEVDAARQQVFVSGGPARNTIFVVGFDGTVRWTLSNVLGASGMVVVDDTLYVAAYDADQIVRYDLTETPPDRLWPVWSVADHPKPGDLEYVGGKLWFGSGSCGSPNDNGSLVGMSLVDQSTVSLTDLAGAYTDWGHCPAIGAGPASDDWLFLWRRGGGQALYSVDIADGTPEIVGEREPSRGDAEPLPGGLVAAHAKNAPGVGVFSPTDFSNELFRYQATYGMTGTIEYTGADGGKLLAAGDGAGYETEILVYDEGVAEATNHIVLSGSYSNPNEIYDRGARFSPDAGRIFAVTGEHENQVVFRIFTSRPSCPGYETSLLNQVRGTPEPDDLVGTAAADVICGFEGDDVIRGLGGNDILIGSKGVDQIEGGAGNDSIDGGLTADTPQDSHPDAGLYGGGGNDRIVGGDGTDFIDGGAGVDDLSGDAHQDVILGGPGGDALHGGSLLDILVGGGGNDTIDGGTGFDCSDYEIDLGPVTGSLVTDEASGPGIGVDTLIGVECLLGTARADRLTGDAAGNTLWGLKGNDTLVGGAGNDYLHGWQGFDSLDGGTGNDLCIVGVGGGSTSGCEDTTLARARAVGVARSVLR